jgi:hypothetical protein
MKTFKIDNVSAQAFQRFVQEFNLQPFRPDQGYPDKLFGEKFGVRYAVSYHSVEQSLFFEVIGNEFSLPLADIQAFVMGELEKATQV